MTTNIIAKSKKRLKEEILEYIRAEVAKGHYPTFMEIEEKFRTNMRTHFSGIRVAYDLAGIPYKREPNPFLKYEKEEKLTAISVKIFRKMSYLIEKISIGPQGSGPDIILKNRNEKLIPVEIKAYHRFGKIKEKQSDKFSKYFRNEIAQLLEYEMQLKSPYGYLVTSTDRKTFRHADPRIRILFSKDIKKLLIEYGMKNELNTLNWIREKASLTETEEKIKAIRNAIVAFVKKEIEDGKYVNKREIQARFKIDLRSYFNSMKEVYQAGGVDPYALSHARMGGQIDKEILKKRIVRYVRRKAGEGNPPTYKEIQRRFQCLPKAFFRGGIREICELAGVCYDRKFATKTPEEKKEMRKRIVDFVKTEAKRKHFPTWREIQNSLSINILHYFDGIQEIYLAAGVVMHPEKGLKVSSSLNATKGPQSSG
jgi:hypothetical protein